MCIAQNVYYLIGYSNILPYFSFMKAAGPKNNKTDDRFSLIEFKDLMFEKIVPLEELLDNRGMPLSKILAYWRRNNLLPFISGGKWLEISFAQLIWLRILDDLRDIGLPLSKVQQVCDYFFKDAYFNDLPKKNLNYNKSLIKKKILAGTQSEEDEQFLLQIEQILKYDKALHFLKFDVNYLSNFIASSISQHDEALIYIFPDGRVREFIGDRYMGHKEYDVDRMEPHICLSITHYFKEFIRDEELSVLFMPQILNEEENKVLREMRKKNIKEITIIFDNDNKPRIESSKNGIMTQEQTRQIKEMLALKNYEKIIIDTIDEKRLSFKRTMKKI